MEREVSIDEFNEFEGSTFRLATAIFEAEYYREYDSDQFNKTELLLSILKLFKVGNVKTTSLSWKSESTEFGLLHDEPWIYHYQYVGVASLIKNKDVPKLQKFWKVMQNHISTNFLLPEIRHESIAIAFDRYNQGMQNRGYPERRNAYAAMGLEALLLTEGDEIKYRLRMRAARILGLLGLNQKKVYDDIGIAYDARSMHMESDWNRRK